MAIRFEDGVKMQSSWLCDSWSSDEDEKENVSPHLPRPETPPPSSFDILSPEEQMDFFASPQTPPPAPLKKRDPNQTPSPFKRAAAVMKQLDVTPSKVTPGRTGTMHEGLVSTREGLSPKKRDELQSRFQKAFEQIISSGEKPDSPQAHQKSMGYAKKLEWVDSILSEIHRSKGASLILFDIEHIVLGERIEVEKVGKLSGKHFFTQQQFEAMVTTCTISSQGIRVVTWQIKVVDTPKRSTIFPDGFSPENLISKFQGTKPLYRRGNRSLRKIDGLCVELYHQNYALRSAFPPFYWNRLEKGKNYTIAVGKTYTTDEILAMVKKLVDESFSYPPGPNPIEFYNAKTEICVVEVASKVGLVDKGIYFEVPKAGLVPGSLSQDDFEELIGEL